MGTVAGGPKPILYATIRQDKFKVFGPIRFMVDTGSQWTVISEKDWRRWRVSFSKLGKPKSFTGLGGCTTLGYPMKNVIIRVRDEGGALITFIMPNVYFLETPKKKREVSAFPSIIGVDFLIQNNLALYFDPKNKRAYFESI